MVRQGRVPLIHTSTCSGFFLRGFVDALGCVLEYARTSAVVLQKICCTTRPHFPCLLEARPLSLPQLRHVLPDALEGQHFASLTCPRCRGWRRIVDSCVRFASGLPFANWEKPDPQDLVNASSFPHQTSGCYPGYFFIDGFFAYGSVRFPHQG